MPDPPPPQPLDKYFSFVPSVIYSFQLIAIKCCSTIPQQFQPIHLPRNIILTKNSIRNIRSPNFWGETPKRGEEGGGLKEELTFFGTVIFFLPLPSGLISWSWSTSNRGPTTMGELATTKTPLRDLRILLNSWRLVH